jgi:hypothetical protein
MALNEPSRPRSEEQIYAVPDIAGSAPRSVGKGIMPPVGPARPGYEYANVQQQQQQPQAGGHIAVAAVLLSSGRAGRGGGVNNSVHPGGRCVEDPNNHYDMMAPKKGKVRVISPLPTNGPVYVPAQMVYAPAQMLRDSGHHSAADFEAGVETGPEYANPNDALKRDSGNEHGNGGGGGAAWAPADEVEYDAVRLPLALHYVNVQPIETHVSDQKYDGMCTSFTSGGDPTQIARTSPPGGGGSLSHQYVNLAGSAAPPLPPLPPHQYVNLQPDGTPFPPLPTTEQPYENIPGADSNVGRVQPEYNTFGDTQQPEYNTFGDTQPYVNLQPTVHVNRSTRYCSFFPTEIYTRGCH